MATIEIATADSLVYQFYPVSGGSLHFTVKTPNDAHVALTEGPSETDHMYEIFIGGWKNSKTAIRKNREKPDKVLQETPSILSGDETRGFWIRWNGGSVAVGKKGESEPFASWEDPEPFPVTHYGVCTGWGATGEWVIEDYLEFQTPDNLEYVYRPIMWGQLNISVRAPNDAHVALTSGPSNTNTVYEIILGGWENTASVIRYRDVQSDKARAEIPDLLSVDEFKEFIIIWKNGTVTVYQDDLLMKWIDPEPFHVTHFGVRTAWGGASGRWRITTGEKYNPLGPKTEPGWNLDNVETTGPAQWVAAKEGEIPPNAIPAGIDNEQLYVGRANHEGALLPGKVVPSHGVCYVPWGGAEYGIPEYEVLCGCDVTWMPANDGEVPSGALASGETEDSEVLFVGRATHEGVVSVGKVQGSHKVCYIPFGGKEIAYPDYEVLVAK